MALLSREREREGVRMREIKEREGDTIAASLYL